MENRSHAMAAGLFVALLTVLVLGMASWLTRDTGVRDVYEISTREVITGLQEQAPVRYRGVDVGKVAQVGFDPKTRGNVLLKLQIDRDAPLTTETYATLSYQGVTGLAYIQLADDGKKVAGKLQHNDEVPPRIPMRPGLLARLEERGEVILTRFEEVSGRVNSLLAEDNQRRIAVALENIGKAADSANKLAERLDTTVVRRIDPVVVDAQAALKTVQRAADQVTQTATEFGKTATEFGKTATEVSQIARRVGAPDGPLDRLSEGTDALSGLADQFGRTTLPRINRITDEVTRTVRSLNRAVTEFNENPQALVYGDGKQRPGPGEEGFRPPGGAR